MEKCLRSIQNTGKENVNLATQVNHHYDASSIIGTSTFQSYQTQQLYTIFHKLNCKSKFIIYLIKWALRKIQYIGKAETAFNIRLINHRKDVTNSKSIPADLYFRQTWARIQSSFKIHINRTTK